MDNGANAVECDVQCSPGGPDFYFSVHHGYAGPGYPQEKADATTQLDAYLKAIKTIAQGNPEYCLHYFDCKIPDGVEEATLVSMGETLVSRINSVLYDAPDPCPVYSIINCADISKAPFLRFREDGLSMPQIGVTCDETGNPQEFYQTVRDLQLGPNVWYTHGTNAVLPDIFEDVMREAVAMRDAGKYAKVAEWTVNRMSSIDTLMRIGIDAIMSDVQYFATNGVKNFLQYVKSSGSLTMATRNDSPFAN